MQTLDFSVYFLHAWQQGLNRYRSARMRPPLKSKGLSRVASKATAVLKLGRSLKPKEPGLWPTHSKAYKEVANILATVPKRLKATT
jgi:hypothetical protein